MLPSLVETHATLWGAETAGYAVPINFLLQPEHIAELLKASGARILVALGPHPVLDIWKKALALRDADAGAHAVLRVAPPGTPPKRGVLDFHTALMAQPDDRLIFGESCRDDDVAAYFHTGGTTGAPKLVAHTHRGQLAAALGGAVLRRHARHRHAHCHAAAVSCRRHDLLRPGCVHGRRRIDRDVARRAAQPGDGAGLLAPRGAARCHAGRRRAHRRWAPCSRCRSVVPTFARVRAGFCGAASLPRPWASAFAQVTGRDLYEVYGMTEASGIIAIDPVAERGRRRARWAGRCPTHESMVRRLECRWRPGRGVATARSA